MKLVIKGNNINVETADDHASRQLGLMYRNFLPQDSGMLFSFPNSEERSFWMKNTFIPLSIAYIDKDGKILNIEDMEPHNLMGVRSTGPAMFALETNKGWFKDRGISTGDIINGLSAGTLGEAKSFDLSSSGFHYSDVSQPIIQRVLDVVSAGLEEQSTTETYEWSYPIAPDTWMEYYEDDGMAFFNVNVNVLPEDFAPNHPGWNIDADAGWSSSSEGEVDINVQFRPGMQLTPEVVMAFERELSNVVPHELHHLTQKGNPFERPNCPAHLPAEGDSYYQYFTQGCEVPAFLIGFRGEAKQSGLAIEKLIDSYLNNYVKVGKISPGESEEVKSIWLGHENWSGEESMQESVLRAYVRSILKEVTTLPKEYFNAIDDAVTASRFWEQPNTQDDIDLISSRVGNSLGTPAAEVLTQALQDAFDDLELDIDVVVSSHETDDIDGSTIHPDHPAYPNRWLIDARWYVSEQRPGRNTVDMEIMTAEEDVADLDPAALMRHITQTVRHELVHYEQMKKQAANKGLDDTAAFEEMKADPSQVPSSGKIEDYLRSHIEIDAHAHDGAEELLAVYGKDEALDMLRHGFDLSDSDMPNAIKHYFEKLPESDPTLDKFRKKLYTQLEQMSS